MPAFSPGLPMPRRTWYLQVSCIALTLSVMLASLPSLAQAQGKERAMEHPTFYRTIQIDVSTLFSIRSINRDFHTREEQFTAMDVRGYGESDHGECEQTV